MNRLITSLSYTVRKLKQVPTQPWIQKPADASVKFSQTDLSHLNIKYFKDLKYQKNFKSKHPQQFPQQPTSSTQPQPLSPVMGPITIQNPKIHDKLYRWCSCGQSLKQPFCDGSHQGTSFKPYKFTVEESVNVMKLCGCKLTKNKPFCDGQSCKCTGGEQKH